MALALIVDSLDAIPEALRGAYVPDGDKFKLDADIPDVDGLKATVAATRRERDAATAQAKAWRALGKTPDEIAEMVAAAETAATAAAKKAGDFDGILNQHKAKWDGEKAELTTRAETALKVARAATVDSGIKSALVTAKATGEGVVLLPKILGERVNSEFVDGAFVTTIMQSDGKTPMIGSGAGGAATYDDLVKDVIKSFPSLFEGTGAGGGGMPPKGTGGAGSKTITRAEFDALGPMEKAATVKTHKIVD